MKLKLGKILLGLVFVWGMSLTPLLACACDHQQTSHDCCAEQAKAHCPEKVTGHSTPCCGGFKTPRLLQKEREDFSPQLSIAPVSYSQKTLSQNIPQHSLKLACEGDEDHPPPELFLENHSLLL